MPTKAIILIMVLLVAGYGLFEARRIIEGPEVVIESPVSGSATSTSILTITGTAKNVSFLTINDKPAFTDEQGRFSLTLSPPTGYTVVTVASIDRFGRRASQSVAITMLDYCPAARNV